MYSGADQSFIQDKLGGLYTVYSCPGYATASSVWHDAALVMDETYPYLMVVMTNVKWEASNTEDRESLEELATALEGVHSDMVHPEKSIKPAVATATPTPTAGGYTDALSGTGEGGEQGRHSHSSMGRTGSDPGAGRRADCKNPLCKRDETAPQNGKNAGEKETEAGNGRTGTFRRRPASGQRRSGADGTGQRRSSRSAPEEESKD